MGAHSFIVGAARQSQVFCVRCSCPAVGIQALLRNIEYSIRGAIVIQMFSLCRTSQMVSHTLARPTSCLRNIARKVFTQTWCRAQSSTRSSQSNRAQRCNKRKGSSAATQLEHINAHTTKRCSRLPAVRFAPLRQRLNSVVLSLRAAWLPLLKSYAVLWMNQVFHDNRRIYSFGYEFLVRCPHCSQCAKVIDRGTNVSPRLLLACSSCGYSRRQHYTGASIGSSVDWYFRLPLWLQTSCCGQTL